MNNIDSSVAGVNYYKELLESSYSTEQILSHAEQLLGGNLSLGFSSFDAPRYNPHRLDKFKWDMNLSKNGNTFSLYLLGLRHIYLLARAFTLHQNNNYIQLADDFLGSFHDYYSKNENLHKMSDNDHALSERIENLVYLHWVTAKYNINLEHQNCLIELVKDAVEKLQQDKYYQKNHNHGIIADKAALIGISALSGGEITIDTEACVDRLKSQVQYAYSKDGVHKENSIDYHIVITASLWGCYYILKYLGHDYAKELYVYLSNANIFTSYCLKPNNFRPLFGDSKGLPSKKKQCDSSNKQIFENVEVFDNDVYLKYIQTHGSEGKQPEQLSKLFPSGYAFFREHFDPMKYYDATWLSLKAGYTTRVHKHRDDLSICLYSKGHDIFVDSGMCGYMPKNKMKDYMESVPAHSTVGVKDLTYPIASGLGDQFKIQKFTQGKYYDYAMASTRVYNGIAIYRHVYYLRAKDIVILRDEIYSDEEHIYAQYYNLSNDISLKQANKEYVKLQIGNASYNAIIKQHYEVNAINVLNGDTTTPPSFLSTGFGTCEESKTLEFLMQGKNCEFITSIEILHNDTEEHSIQLQGGTIAIEPGKLEIPITKTKMVRFNHAEVSVIENVLCIKNFGDSDENKFAFYAVGPEKTYKSSYTKDEFMHYENTLESNFVIMYFITNDSGETLKGILCECTNSNQHIEIRKVYPTLHKPIVIGHSIEETGMNAYRFTVDVDYDYPTICKWWVYYNGANQYFVQNSSYEFTFTFEQTGEYVVMYSFRDKYFGEFVFEQFEKIIIRDEDTNKTEGEASF